MHLYLTFGLVYVNITDWCQCMYVLYPFRGYHYQHHQPSIWCGQWLHWGICNFFHFNYRISLTNVVYPVDSVHILHPHGLMVYMIYINRNIVHTSISIKYLLNSIVEHIAYFLYISKNSLSSVYICFYLS